MADLFNKVVDNVSFEWDEKNANGQNQKADRVSDF